jgi:hypothetical protein
MAKKNRRHHRDATAASTPSQEPGADPPAKMKRKDYEREMRRLHGELVANPVLWLAGQDYRAADAARTASLQVIRQRRGPERIGAER